MVLPAQTIVEKFEVPFIPVAVGNKLVPQSFIQNCISRITLPINTPALYSFTNTAHTATCPSRVGNIVISPVDALIATGGADVSQFVALYPASQPTSTVALLLGLINEYAKESPFGSITP